MATIRQDRFPLGESEDALAERDVANALAATAEERMEAAITLLDVAVALWISRGLSDDQGLCRLPRCTQQRRRLVRRDRRNGAVLLKD